MTDKGAFEAWFATQYEKDPDRSPLSSRDGWNAAIEHMAQQARKPNQHPDDDAVDRFAERMKWKLANARDKGKSGWQDRAWTPEQISNALREHVDKGDPTDVANYCMFLSARGEPITAQQERKPDKLFAQKNEREIRDQLGLVQRYPVQINLNGDFVMVEGNSHKDAVQKYLAQKERKRRAWPDGTVWDVDPADMAQQERKPMTGTEVMDEYIKTGRFNQFVEAFFAGVKCAEDFHGIKETP